MCLFCCLCFFLFFFFRRFFFFQAEDGIRGLVRSRGLGDVYKRQASNASTITESSSFSSLAAPNTTANNFSSVSEP